MVWVGSDYFERNKFNATQTARQRDTEASKSAGLKATWDGDNISLVVCSVAATRRGGKRNNGGRNILEELRAVAGMEAKDPGGNAAPWLVAAPGKADEFMIGTRQASQMPLGPSVALDGTRLFCHPSFPLAKHILCLRLQ